jgi:hypothetical protein
MVQTSGEARLRKTGGAMVRSQAMFRKSGGAMVQTSGEVAEAQPWQLPQKAQPLASSATGFCSQIPSGWLLLALAFPCIKRSHSHGMAYQVGIHSLCKRCLAPHHVTTHPCLIPCTAGWVGLEHQPAAACTLAWLLQPWMAFSANFTARIYELAPTRPATHRGSVVQEWHLMLSRKCLGASNSSPRAF